MCIWHVVLGILYWLVHLFGRLSHSVSFFNWDTTQKLNYVNLVFMSLYVRIDLNGGLVLNND